jgi:hypothetical protein
VVAVAAVAAREASLKPPTVGSGWGAGQTNSLSDTLRVTGDISEENGNDNEVALQHLAQETGGGYIDRDHLRKLLEQMIQDMTTYYVASYVPAIKEYDGGFRPVAVKP